MFESNRLQLSSLLLLNFPFAAFFSRLTLNPVMARHELRLEAQRTITGPLWHLAECTERAITRHDVNASRGKKDREPF